MIMVDIPLPGKCIDCPFSYWIQSGYYEGMLMCNAMEAKAGKEGYDKGEFTVDEFREKRPNNCPIDSGVIPNYCQSCGKPIFRIMK